MKILLWNFYYLPVTGGTETFTHALALAFKRKGHEVIVFRSHLETSVYKESEIEGVRVFSFPFELSFKQNDLKKIKEIIQKCLQVLNNFNPDIASLHIWNEILSFYQFRILKNIPFCLTLHGLIEKSYMSKIRLELWDAASHVSTVSDALIQTLKKDQLKHPNLLRIYNGLESSLFENPSAEGRKNHILMVGRLSPEKRFDFGFKILKKLQLKHPNIHLTLIGEGEERLLLEKHLEELQLKDAVTMLGIISPYKIPEYIDQASIVLIPSSYESFCLVALEAALRYKPVVASKVEGLKEVVQDQVTGILVEPSDLHGFTNAIDDLFMHPEKAKRMGEQAKARALNLFTIETAVENYLKMYSDAISKKQNHTIS